MKIYIYIFILISLCYIVTKGQQPSLYNTHTLTEATINPYVGVFDDIACRRIASNFFVSSIYVNGYAKNEILKNLDWNAIIKGQYTALNAGDFDSPNHYRIFNDLFVNFLTIKYLLNEAYQTELMLNLGIRSLFGARGRNNFLSSITDTFNYDLFQSNSPHYFNAKGYGYVGSAIELGWRSEIDILPDMVVGAKLSYIEGIAGAQANWKATVSDIQSDSSIALTYSANGFYSHSGQAFSIEEILPRFRNPGLSLSFGMQQSIGEGLKYSIVIKDLGFIRWRNATYLLPQIDQATYSIDSSGMGWIDRQYIVNQIESRIVSRNKIQMLPLRIEAGLGYIVAGFYNIHAHASYIPHIQNIFLNTMHDLHWGWLHSIVNIGYNNDRVLHTGLNLLVRTTRFEAYVGTENIYSTYQAIKYYTSKDYSFGRTVAWSLHFGFAYKLGNCGGDNKAFGKKNDLMDFKGKGKKGAVNCYEF